MDASADSAFPTDPQDTLCAKQAVCTGYLYYPCGNRRLYRDYLYQGCIVVRPDEIAALVFRVSVNYCAVIYAADYSSQNILSEEVS